MFCCESQTANGRSTVKSIVLKNPYIVPEIVSLAPLEVIETQKRARISTKFRHLTLKYDLFDIENDLKCWWKWHYRKQVNVT